VFVIEGSGIFFVVEVVVFEFLVSSGVGEVVEYLVGVEFIVELVVFW